jgi:hypothetical protein
MAVFAATDYSIVYNNVELSVYLKGVTLDALVADLDTTGMGTTNNAFHTRITGLKDWKGSLDLFQDYAAGEVDATIAPDVISGTARTLTIKPTSAAVSATNPRYFGSIIVSDYVPFTVTAPGEVAQAKITFVGAGPLTRATT